jgi:hypothetical protein
MKPIGLVFAATLIALFACDGAVAPIKAPTDAVRCSAQPAAGVLAQFDFESLLSQLPRVTDAREDHHGVWQGDPPTLEPGPPGCGQALAFGNSGESYVEIPHSPAWDLNQGAVDLWFKPESCGDEEQGVITRDAENAQFSGHFRLFWLDDCRLAARTQVASPVGADVAVEVATSNPLDVGRWNHFAVNFGAPGLELWLNGQRVGFAPTMSGIAGNTNPWTIGTSNDKSAEGSSIPTWKPLRNAAVDRVRIWNRREDFGSRSLSNDF